MATERYGWIRDGLKKRGYRAKDLARAWGISESSTSRFLSGEEQPDLPLSRAATLAGLLGISLDELAKGMGVKGKTVVPDIATAAQANGHVPPNTMQVTILPGKRVRVAFNQELTAAKAGALVELMGDTGE